MKSMQSFQILLNQGGESPGGPIMLHQTLTASVFLDLQYAGMLTGLTPMQRFISCIAQITTLSGNNVFRHIVRDIKVTLLKFRISAG